MDKQKTMRRMKHFSDFVDKHLDRCEDKIEDRLDEIIFDLRDITGVDFPSKDEAEEAPEADEEPATILMKDIYKLNGDVAHTIMALRKMLYDLDVCFDQMTDILDDGQ